MPTKNPVPKHDGSDDFEHAIRHGPQPIDGPLPGQDWGANHHRPNPPHAAARPEGPAPYETYPKPEDLPVPMQPGAGMSAENAPKVDVPKVDKKD